MTGELDLIEVARDVYMLRGPHGAANSGFVVGDRAVALVDAQASPRLGAAVRRFVESVTDVPVRYAVITHHHGDHLLGIQSWPGVLTLAHPRCGRLLRTLAGPDRDRIDPEALLRVFVGAAAAEQLDRMADHPIRRKLAGSDYRDVRLKIPQALPFESDSGTVTLDLGGVGLAISHPGPAHGDDDLLVSVTGRDVLFLGDLGFVDRIPAVTAPYLNEWTVLTERLLHDDAGVIVPGHGPPAAPEALRTQLDYLRALGDAATRPAQALAGFASVPGFARWHAVNMAVLAAASRTAKDESR